MLSLGIKLGMINADSSRGNSGLTPTPPEPPAENSVTLSADNLSIPAAGAVPVRATLAEVRLVNTVLVLETSNAAAEVVSPQTILAGDLFVEFFVANPSGPAGEAVLSATTDVVVNNTLTFQLSGT